MVFGIFISVVFERLILSIRSSKALSLSKAMPLSARASSIGALNCDTFIRPLLVVAMRPSRSMCRRSSAVSLTYSLSDSCMKLPFDCESFSTSSAIFIFLSLLICMSPDISNQLAALLIFMVKSFGVSWLLTTFSFSPSGHSIFEQSFFSCSCSSSRRHSSG